MNPDLDLVLDRVIKAPRATLWNAWTDPAAFARWWLPSPTQCRVERLEARPGGGVPRGLLAPLLDLGLRFDARRVRGDDVALRDLIETLPREIELVKSTEGTIEEYRKVGAEVLLLHGSRTDDLFTATANALDRVIPRSTSLAVPGLDHGSA